MSRSLTDHSSTESERDERVCKILFCCSQNTLISGGTFWLQVSSRIIDCKSLWSDSSNWISCSSNFLFHHSSLALAFFSCCFCSASFLAYPHFRQIAIVFSGIAFAHLIPSICTCTDVLVSFIFAEEHEVQH